MPKKNYINYVKTSGKKTLQEKRNIPICVCVCVSFKQGTITWKIFLKTEISFFYLFGISIHYGFNWGKNPCFIFCFTFWFRINTKTERKHIVFCLSLLFFLIFVYYIILKQTKRARTRKKFAEFKTQAWKLMLQKF